MTTSVNFPGHNGETLAGRIDRPAGEIRAWALFAHCFSCSKDVAAARTIARSLAEKGIAVLRFDFTGLGHSGGDFADTNFSSNLDDLEAAAKWLAENETAPSLLIGHSLGGAAAISVAGRIASVKAVATIGAPAEADHVVETFSHYIEDIARDGEAKVELAGRPFTIRQHFVDDVRAADVSGAASDLKKPLLILHAPTDDVVGIENATALFVAAKHPKSFASLDTADHLLTRRADAEYAADLIAVWATRYIPTEAIAGPDPADRPPEGIVRTVETGRGRYANTVSSGRHVLPAGEPESLGGDDFGPGPFDYLSASLGACTSMTLRMYAERKGWDIGRITVDVRHEKQDDAATGERIDVFNRVIAVEGVEDPDKRARLVEIADKCPVHKTLKSASHIRTRYGHDVI